MILCPTDAPEGLISPRTVTTRIALGLFLFTPFFFSHLEIKRAALYCSCWNTANCSQGSKMLYFLPSTSNHHPVNLHMQVGWRCWDPHSSLPCLRVSLLRTYFTTPEMEGNWQYTTNTDAVLFIQGISKLYQGKLWLLPHFTGKMKQTRLKQLA